MAETMAPVPNEDLADLGRKLGEHFALGAQQVWLVDPERQRVAVYRSLIGVRVHEANEELEGGELLPNFRCKVADLLMVG